MNNTISNEKILKQFYSEIIPHLSGISTHLDVGHGKNLKFILNIAHMFSDIGGDNTKFVYYDNRDFIERLMSDKKRVVLPDNISLTYNPKAPVDSVSYFFTIHDFVGTRQPPVESFKEMHGILREGGPVMVIDYDLFHVRMKHAPKHAFDEMFNAGNEKKCLVTEPDCYKRHTSYSRAMCVRDLQDSGFGIVKAYSLPQENPKLFLTLARRW